MSGVRWCVPWADITSPEALEPDEDEERWSVSGIYTRPVGEDAFYAVTLAFANKERSDGVSLDAWLAEASWHPNARWTWFARGEAIAPERIEPAYLRNNVALTIAEQQALRASRQS
mgnify:CR=1 FL=1